MESPLHRYCVLFFTRFLPSFFFFFRPFPSSSSKRSFSLIMRVNLFVFRRHGEKLRPQVVRNVSVTTSAMIALVAFRRREKSKGFKKEGGKGGLLNFIIADRTSGLNLLSVTRENKRSPFHEFRNSINIYLQNTPSRLSSFHPRFYIHFSTERVNNKIRSRLLYIIPVKNRGGK